MRPYAGFWMRVLAYVIDNVIIGFVLFFVISIPAIVLTAFLAAADHSGAVAMVFVILLGFFKAIITLVGGWLYFALMESSRAQGTLGKMALGLKVVDEQGNRIGFGRATGRYFAKIISSIILCIGYMMAGWTERKQGLHDLIAHTLVIKKSASHDFPPPSQANPPM